MKIKDTLDGFAALVRIDFEGGVVGVAAERSREPEPLEGSRGPSQFLEQILEI